MMLQFSCDKRNLDLCPDCMETEPVNIKLYVTFDPYQGDMYLPPVIKVYEGNIEDNLLLITIEPDASPEEIPVMINKKYTITATYYYYGHNVIAYDSTTPRVRSNNHDCGKLCYFGLDNKADLRLKYIP